MTEHQRLFLVQARTDFVVFDLLQNQVDLPECHALHYLQMATELLGKAHAWKIGPQPNTHKAFVGFLRSLRTNRKVQKTLGRDGQNAEWENMIRKSIPLAESIQGLAPALAGDGPNPEYPWPGEDPEFTPSEHRFVLWEELQDTSPGRQFLDLIHVLFETAEMYL